VEECKSERAAEKENHDVTNELEQAPVAVPSD